MNTIVNHIGAIHFEGNIVPHEWYDRIKLPSGKTDLVAITILAEIVYWYRPVKALSHQDGRPLPPRAKFQGDMFKGGASYFMAKFGLTKEQARTALRRLESQNLIRREYRVIEQQFSGDIYNVSFVEPVPERILEITHPAKSVAPPTAPTDGQPLAPVSEGGCLRTPGGVSQNTGGGPNTPLRRLIKRLIKQQLPPLPKVGRMPIPWTTVVVVVVKRRMGKSPRPQREPTSNELNRGSGFLPRD